MHFAGKCRYYKLTVARIPQADFEVRAIRKPLMTAVPCYSDHELENPVFRLGGPGVFLFPCPAPKCAGASIYVAGMPHPPAGGTSWTPCR